MAAQVVVVDATVVIASFLKEGHTRRALLESAGVQFVAPPKLHEECLAVLGELALRAHVGLEAAAALMHELLLVVGTVAPTAYAAQRSRAQRACNDAKAWDDDEYVALALALDAPIWTYDKDFARIAGIRTITTAKIAGLLE